MNFLRTLFLLAAGLSVVLSRRGKAVYQFANMIEKLTKNPFWWFLKYGCHCGYGGSGRAVDDLDSCCKVHDRCYGFAQNQHHCNSQLDPYFKPYEYSTASPGRITCFKNQSYCRWYICECDRKAAECFASSTYHGRVWNWPQDRCR